MKYKVLVTFRDKVDNKTRYVQGEEYPKGKFKPSKKRIEYLGNIGLIEIPIKEPTLKVDESLLKDELLEIAETLNLEVNEKMTKKDLVEIINERE